jgi:ferredoxin-NADP reductase
VRDRSGLSRSDELSALAAAHPNFTCLPAVWEDGESGDIAALLKRRFAQHPAKTTRVFLCGAPDLMNSLRRQVFLQGAASSHIFVDPFVVAPAPIR